MKEAKESEELKPIEITLSGSPLSTQHIYRRNPQGRGVYMTKEAKALKEQYQWEIRKQYSGPVIEDDVSIVIVLFFSNKLRRDWDNWHKLSCDALEGLVLKNDSQIKEATVFVSHDKENPRMELLLVRK